MRAWFLQEYEGSHVKGMQVVIRMEAEYNDSRQAERGGATPSVVALFAASFIIRRWLSGRLTPNHNSDGISPKDCFRTSWIICNLTCVVNIAAKHWAGR